MAANPSVASRTAIELGIEQRNSDGDLEIRTAGLTQIPIYNAFNPLEARGETTELTRAKTGLAGDGVTIGAMSYALAGEFYIFGSGIANLPPSYFEIIRASGFKEIRLASIDRPAAVSFAAASQGSGGSLSAGGYAWCFTTLYQSDGSTEATTAANAAFESRAAIAASTGNVVTAVTDTSTVDNDSALITGLPSAGIKRLYRTKAGNHASTDPKDFYFVAEVANGVTSYTDTTADKNLGRRAPFTGKVPVGSFAGAGDTDGALDDGAVYKYRFSLLYDADGALASSEETAAYEALIPSADEVEVDLDSGKDAVDLSGLPSSGIKRIYRTEGGGTTFKYLASVASGTTTYTDLLADSALGHDMVEYSDQAIYRLVSEYLDFDALTVLSYLDSRKYPAKSVRGGFSLDAPAGGNALVRFTLEGVYNTSTKVANPTLISNPGSIPQVCDIALKVTAENEPSDRTLRVLGVGIEVPRTPGARRDANASCDNSGVVEYQINGPFRPRFTCSFEVPKEIGAGTDTDWVNDFKASTFFAIQFKIGTDARKRVYFQNWTPWGEKRYLAQMVEPPRFDIDQATGNRIFNGVFELTERTGIDNSALYIIHK